MLTLSRCGRNDPLDLENSGGPVFFLSVKYVLHVFLGSTLSNGGDLTAFKLKM